MSSFLYLEINKLLNKDTPEFIEGRVFKMIIPIPEMKIEGISAGVIEGAVGGLNGGLNKELTALYNSVKEHPGKKAKELAIILSRPLDTVDKQISKLIDQKLIERRGSKKTGGYYIKTTDKKEN